MSWQNWWQLAKSDYLKLVPILALAVYIAFIPNQNYPYLVHIDEWVHLAYSKAMLQAASTTFTDPFFGQGVVGLSTHLEAGFHLFLGVFHRISGISWLTIFRYFPSVIFAVTVLSVYVMARRWGFGWEAAFFTALIPTTVGILGPAFLVPVAMGLLYVPLSLFLAFNFRTAWSYLTLFIFASFLLAIHAPSAIFVGLVLAPYLLLNLKGNFKHSLAIALALVIPFLAPFPWIFALLLPTAKSLLSQTPVPTHIDFPMVIKTYGYLPISLCLLGTFRLVIRGDKKSYGLVFGLLALLALLVTFYTFHYGVSILYQRGLMFMMLMLGIIAGAGLAGIRSFRLPRWPVKGNPLPAKVTGIVLCLVIIGATIAMTLPKRQDTPYYHMINQQDYEAFVWIGNNVGEGYNKAILDPWKATAFSAITQKYIYTRIHARPMPRDQEAAKFLKGGCADTDFLRKNGISIVYTREPSSNPDLVEIREWVYLLR